MRYKTLPYTEKRKRKKKSLQGNQNPKKVLTFVSFMDSGVSYRDTTCEADSTSTKQCISSKKNYQIMGDSFFGSDDMIDTGDDVDFMYREDLEGMRREKKPTRRRKSLFTFTECFEFLKLFKLCLYSSSR